MHGCGLQQADDQRPVPTGTSSQQDSKVVPVAGEADALQYQHLDRNLSCGNPPRQEPNLKLLSHGK